MYIRHCELVMENWHVYVWCFNFVYAWWILLSCYFSVSVVYITYTANDNIVIILPHCVTYIDIMLLCHEHRLVMSLIEYLSRWELSWWTRLVTFEQCVRWFICEWILSCASTKFWWVKCLQVTNNVNSLFEYELF